MPAILLSSSLLPLLSAAYVTAQSAYLETSKLDHGKTLYWIWCFNIRKGRISKHLPTGFTEGLSLLIVGSIGNNNRYLIEPTIAVHFWSITATIWTNHSLASQRKSVLKACVSINHNLAMSLFRPSIGRSTHLVTKMERFTEACD